MTDTAYHINSLTKKAIAITNEEWDEISNMLCAKNLQLYFKIVPLKVAVSSLCESLDFTKEAEQVAEEVMA
jgi:hypothetical protein